MKRKNESGIVVVEALIVVTVVIVFLTVMLYLGMILYQQAVVNIMANQTAASIAQIYGNTLHDPFTGYVDIDGVDETVSYSGIRDQAYQDVMKQKADAFALYRLRSSRILNTGVTQVDVQIVPKSNELLKEQIVVTVHESHAVGLVSFFGIENNTLTFTGTGRADCVDRLDYFAGVPALGTSDGNAVIFRDECTVNFYKHYGDDRPLKTITVLKGYSVSASAERTHCAMPTGVVQEKMDFSYWVTASGDVFNAGTAVNADMNVYGVWGCTITFDPQGGTLVDMDDNKMDAIVHRNVTLPKAVRENCTFAGWYTQPNGEGEEFTGNNVQGDITVYAKWVCTVTFNPDGGAVEPDSYVVIYGQSLGDAGYSLPEATRADCTFANWYTEYYGEGTEFTATTDVQGHITVVAKWTCVINFLDDNGATLFESQTVVAGKSATLPTPERAHSEDGSKGWQFLGWQDAAGAPYHSEETAITGNVDLYAHWECKHDISATKNKITSVSASSCKQQSYTINKCQYCDHTETFYGARGKCRNGYCGGQCRSLGGGPWYNKGAHTVYCEHVWWAAHWQCPDCYDMSSVADVCGNCITRNTSNGNTWSWKNTHWHG